MPSSRVPCSTPAARSAVRTGRFDSRRAVPVIARKPERALLSFKRLRARKSLEEAAQRAAWPPANRQCARFRREMATTLTLAWISNALGMPGSEQGGRSICGPADGFLQSRTLSDALSYFRDDCAWKRSIALREDPHLLLDPEGVLSSPADQGPGAPDIDAGTNRPSWLLLFGVGLGAALPGGGNRW